MSAHFLAYPIRFAFDVLKMGCLAHLVISEVIQFAPAAGPSMLPTFTVDGDWIAVDMRAKYGRRIANGDLVMFHIPTSKHSIGIKRLLGMPGDFVSIGTPGEPGEEKMIQVPEGHCWVAGDNMTASRDSRVYGPLPLGLVQGKVLGKVLPWTERHWAVNGLHQVRDES